jgi:hypothetical protein
MGEGGFEMKTMRSLCFVSMIVSVFAGLCLEGRAQTKGSPPVINFSWAQEKIRQGEDWRIYLSATDPDGDMYRIFCRVEQTGGQNYRQDITNIKKGMEGQLTGYLVLRTQSIQDLYQVSLSLTVIIADRAGNESNPLVFPLTINGERTKPPPADQVSPELAKALNQRITYLGIDLIRRDRMGAGD